MSELEPVYNRQADGKFGPGNNAFPQGGTPRLNFLRICEEEAFLRSVDLNEVVYDVLMAMVDRAKAGDAQAAKLVLDRLCGLQKDTPPVVIDQRQVSIGPPEPGGGDVGDYIAEMQRVAAQVGQVNGAKARGLSVPSPSTQAAPDLSEGGEDAEAKEDPKESLGEDGPEHTPEPQTLDVQAPTSPLREQYEAAEAAGKPQERQRM